MTHPTDDEIMELAGAWFHTGENQKRDDGYYYRSLGTPSNVRGSDLIEFARALLAEQARTEPHSQATREPVGLPVFTPLNPIQEVYDKLHAGKLGAHWLWVVIEQIAAGIPEADAMREFGYYAQPHKAEDAPSDAELLATVECLTDESGADYVVVLRTDRPKLYGKEHRRESAAQRVADTINAEFRRAAITQERKA